MPERRFRIREAVGAQVETFRTATAVMYRRTPLDLRHRQLAITHDL